MSAKIVILGAGGLVGTRFSEHIVGMGEISLAGVERSVSLSKVVLFDLKVPETISQKTRQDARVTVQVGDLTNKDDIAQALAPEGCDHVIVFHLAALLSGYAEEDFDLGMKINLQGTIGIMEEVRNISKQIGSPQRYVYVSTDYVSCFNEYNRTHPVTEESFRLSPVSYGCQKACCELLICDYSRKGFLDGRVARLSAVLGRPGWSNSISYPYTGIFTQTLEGKEYEVPLPMDIPYPCSSLNNNIKGMFHLGVGVSAEQLGHNRVVQIPADSFTLNDIWAAAQSVAKDLGIKIGTIRNVKPTSGTTTVKEINVCPRVNCTKAKELGLPMNVDLKEIIADYANTYIKRG